MKILVFVGAASARKPLFSQKVKTLLSFSFFLVNNAKRNAAIFVLYLLVFSRARFSFDIKECAGDKSENKNARAIERFDRKGSRARSTKGSPTIDSKQTPFMFLQSPFSQKEISDHNKTSKLFFCAKMWNKFFEFRNKNKRKKIVPHTTSPFF